MTEQQPDARLTRRVPVEGCVICDGEPVTVDLWCGKRCAEHPPGFSAATAVDLAVKALPGAAGAYCRNEWPDGVV